MNYIENLKSKLDSTFKAVLGKHINEEIILSFHQLTPPDQCNLLSGIFYVIWNQCPAGTKNYTRDELRSISDKFAYLEIMLVGDSMPKEYFKQKAQQSIEILERLNILKHVKKSISIN